MKRYRVHFVADAEEDLFEIYNYVSVKDSPARAEKLLNRIEKICHNLATFPNRGRIPPELARIGIVAYKEVHCKPYRIVCQIIEANIYIHCILDSRRDLQELLQERLIR